MSETTIAAHKIYAYRATHYRLVSVAQGDARIRVHTLSNFVPTQSGWPPPQSLLFTSGEGYQ